MAKNRTQKRIQQGGGLGSSSGSSYHVPDVVLQMPELFLFDLQKFQNSLRQAKQIDHPSRARLYDLFKSAELDIHYMAVLSKRLRGVTRIPIEFHRDGKPDDVITPQLRSPWFKEVRKEIALAQFWGFSLMQFYLDEEGNIRADQINRKHYNPISRQLLRYQEDQEGAPIDEFDNMLFVGSEHDLGALVDIMIAILYKRGNISDWAKFCNIFGIPIREYTYDAQDNEARLKLIEDARRQGSSAVYIHPKESSLVLHEPKNASATGELFERSINYWDTKISARVVGNTLTTEADKVGTQALGKVHKEVEEEMNEDDRDTILDVLNYHMRPIFSALGFNTDGGEFIYANKDKTHPTQQVDIVLKLNSIGLPISDDYLYEFSGIPKPDNYDELLTEKKAEKEAMQAQLLGGEATPTDEGNLSEEEKTKGNTPPQGKKGLRNLLSRFFSLAPLPGGADSDF